MEKNPKMRRFIECYVPFTACNLRCEYCYVTQNNWWNGKKPDLNRCLKNLKDAVSVDRLGGICMFNLCATGETLLYPEIIDILTSILSNGHYVMLVTNGTLVDRFAACCGFPKEFRERLFFKFSFHYLELKKQNKLNTYVKNVHMVRDAGISYTIELTPDDSYIPFIDEIKDFCINNFGALCHVTVTRDETKKGYPLMTSLPREEFKRTWEQFDSDLFNYKYQLFEVKRHEFCYAGDWGIVVNLGTGEYRQCYKGKALGNIYDLDKELTFLPIGHHCQEGHCFNGHAFLGFGLIPGLDTVDYADMRNRKLSDGTQWLSDTMESFMRNRLKDSNSEVSGIEAIKDDLKSINPKQTIKRIIGRKQ